MAVAPLDAVLNISSTIRQLVCSVQQHVPRLQTFLETAAEEAHFAAKQRLLNASSGGPPASVTSSAADANGTAVVSLGRKDGWCRGLIHYRPSLEPWHAQDAPCLNPGHAQDEPCSGALERMAESGGEDKPLGMSPVDKVPSTRPTLNIGFSGVCRVQG